MATSKNTAIPQTDRDRARLVAQIRRFRPLLSSEDVPDLLKLVSDETGDARCALTLATLLGEELHLIGANDVSAALYMADMHSRLCALKNNFELLTFVIDEVGKRIEDVADLHGGLATLQKEAKRVIQ